MKRIGKLLRQRAGMTLLELMVGLMCFSIIAVAVTGIMSPMLKAYANANAQAEINTLLDTLSGEITTTAAAASELACDGASITIGTSSHNKSYGVNDAGYLYVDSKDVLLLDAGYYKDKSVKLEFFTDMTLVTPLKRAITDDTALSFVMKLSIMEKGSELASRVYAIRPMGMNQY